MASVDNITQHETGTPDVEKVRAQLTGASSTYVSRKFVNVEGAVVSVEGTNSMTWTRSGATITITGTNDDWVDIIIWGQK